MSSPTTANHGQRLSRRAAMNATIASMNSTVHTASDDCVDAYTVLNEQRPASSAATVATRASNHSRAATKTSSGTQEFNATCASSGIAG